MEATIACPIFTGLITYYIEGDTHERGHLMEETLANPQRAVGIRGNCFSFLLPWAYVMSRLYNAFARRDFSEWPLDHRRACWGFEGHGEVYLGTACHRLEDPSEDRVVM